MFWALKGNKFGTLLKVKCLILLNIFSVFPTHVGMFPTSSTLNRTISSLPHVCGDVPYVQFVMTGKIESSPRMWGCSCSSGSHSLSIRVSFPSLSPPVYPIDVSFMGFPPAFSASLHKDDPALSHSMKGFPLWMTHDVHLLAFV